MKVLEAKVIYESDKYRKIQENNFRYFFMIWSYRSKDRGTSFKIKDP